MKCIYVGEVVFFHLEWVKITINVPMIKYRHHIVISIVDGDNDVDDISIVPGGSDPSLQVV